MIVERELLEQLLDLMEPCRTQADWEPWDAENERCIPFSTYECDRCVARRELQVLLEEDATQEPVPTFKNRWKFDAARYR